MKDKFEIKLKCVFCGSTIFELPSNDYHPKEGELIKCGNCGRLDDFTSLRNLTIKQSEKLIKKELEKEIKNIFKKSGLKVR